MEDLNGGRRKAIRQNAVEFLFQAQLAVGVLAEEVEGPSERVGGGLVAGDEDGDGFVAKLARAHRLAGLLIAGFHQHGEQVPGTRGDPMASPPLDGGIDKAVEGGDGLIEPDVLRRGERVGG